MFLLNEPENYILKKLFRIEKDKIYDNYFEMLDIKIKSREHCLIDRGFVKDVIKFHNELMEISRCDYNKEEDKTRKIVRGGCDILFMPDYSLPNHKLKIHVIYYIKNALEDSDIFVRAHEETHSLHRMKKLNLLEKKLIEINAPIKLNENIADFHKCTDFEKELTANIGGFYALQKNNFNREKRELVSTDSISGFFSDVIYELAIENPKIADLFFKEIIEQNRLIKDEFELFKKYTDL